jgi:uroporphyrin-3 C-methyltransferase
MISPTPADASQPQGAASARPDAGRPEAGRPDPALEITMLDGEPAPYAENTTSMGNSPSINPSVAANTPRNSTHSLATLWAVAALVLAGAAMLVSLLLWQRLSTMQEQLARQNLDAGNQSVEARTLARQAQEQALEAGTRVSVLEGRVGELAAQRAQIDALISAASRSADDSLIADLEASLRTAQEQTQLTGSASPLLAALQSAQRRVAASTVPNAARIQRALTADIARIKATPSTDTAAVLARLDELVRVVDLLPTIHDARRTTAPADPQPDAAPGATSRLGKALQAFWLQLSSLVRVSEIEPHHGNWNTALLAPEQADQLRTSMKQRLLGARMGMLARQPEAVRGDLAAVSDLLDRYFDPGSRHTQAMANTLGQLRGEVLTWDAPRIDDSLAALASAAN